MRYSFLALCAAMLTSCCAPRYLQVRSAYLTPCDLAAYQIGAKELGERCYLGQEVVIFWKTPRCHCEKALSLCLDLCYGNQERESILFPLDTSRGYLTYRLLNEEYWNKRGIVAYKVELFADGESISFWRHHLFVERIDL